MTCRYKPSPYWDWNDTLMYSITIKCNYPKPTVLRFFYPINGDRILIRWTFVPARLKNKDKLTSSQQENLSTYLML